MSNPVPGAPNRDGVAMAADSSEVAPPTRVPISSSGSSAATSGAAAASGAPVVAQVAPAPGATPSSSSSGGSQAQSSQLATSSRSKYRTFILTNGVFEVEQRYEIRDVIGQGAYGVVCSALDRKTNSMVAVKKIENVFDHRSLAKRTLRELKLVRTFNHENILGLDRVMRPHSNTFHNIYLCSELMETDLACVIRSPQELTDEHVQFFIYQLLRGLKFIHSANVIHRDLKPRNLLVNSNCVVGGQLVTLSNGVGRMIDDFVGGESVLSCDPKLADAAAPAAAAAKAAARTGVCEGVVAEAIHRGVTTKPVLKITLLDGRELLVTEEHRVLTSGGWKEARQLTSADRVVCTTQPTLPLPVTPAQLRWSLAAGPLHFDCATTEALARAEAFARVLGFMMTKGDAATRSGSSTWSASTAHLIDASSLRNDVELLTGPALMREELQHGYRYTVDAGPMLSGALTQLTGWDAQPSSSRSFPPFMLDPACPLTLKREFLCGMLGGAGHAPRVLLTQGAATLDHATLLSMPGLARGSEALRHCETVVRHLCALMDQLGVSGTAIELRPHADDDSRRLLSITLVASPKGDTALSFARTLGFRYAWQKQRRLDIVRSYLELSHRPLPDTKCPSLLQFLHSIDESSALTSAASDSDSDPDPSLAQCNAVPGLHLPVHSVVSLPGRFPVHDLSVPVTSSFVVNGCCVHNCLIGSTPIALANGFSMPIRAVVADTALMSFDEQQRGHMLKPTSALLEQGVKGCVELLFSDGRTITCTPDHRFLDVDGQWITAAKMTPEHTEIVAGIEYPALQLEDGGELAWSLQLPSLGYALNMAERREETLAFAGLLGFLHTEGGSLSKTGAQLTAAHQLDMEWLQRDIKLLTGEEAKPDADPDALAIHLPQALADALKTAGVAEAENRELSWHGFPAFLLAANCPAAVVQAFLGGLFGGDGQAPSLSWCGDKATGVVDMRWRCRRAGAVRVEAAKALSAQLQALFSRVGMPESSICFDDAVQQEDADPNQNVSLMWRLVGDATLPFAERIGFRYSCHKQMRLTAVAAYFRLRATLERQKQFLQVHMQTHNPAGQAPPSQLRELLQEAKAQLALQENVLPAIVAVEPCEVQREEMFGDGAHLVPGIHESLDSFDALKFFSSERPQGDKYDATKQASPGSPHKMACAVPAGSPALPTFKVKLIGRRQLAEAQEVFDLTVPETHNFLANSLTSHNCDLKICDFGLARVDDPDNRDRTVMSNYVATRWYRAPEIIRGKKYDKAVDMWSVGCILAELIGRKPIFPGRDSFHQITLIVSVLGTPPKPPSASTAGTSGAAPAAAAAAASSTSSSSSSSRGPTDDYISALPAKAKIPFRQLYPRASPLACDLLDRLLCFEPAQRLTVEQALKHPYLADLHCEDDEPVCTQMDFTDFYFEYLKLSKEDLRVLIHQEIVNHYKEETVDVPPTPLDSINALRAGLPKATQPPQGAKKGRRKSF